MSKGQLHQLFPVESDLQGKAQRLIAEAMTTFGKPERFDGYVKSLKMFEDQRCQEESTETQAITTTVSEKLHYVFDTLVPYWNAFAKKERTNQEARANVELNDGTVLLNDVPATALLGLERRLKDIRIMCERIPTLLPGSKWSRSQDEEGVWICDDDETRLKTEKDVKFKSVAVSTVQHPEQVEKWTADIPVGTYRTSRTTARLSPGDKSKLLGRIDEILLAVKKARTVANSVPIEDIAIGDKIRKYILDPLI